jgi:plastocyanin
MTHRSTLASLLSVLALLAAGGRGPALARAPSVEASVTDQSGKPVLDAVVTLMPVGGPPPALRPMPAVMDQVNKEFVPAVLPVVVGTPVSFPNRDNIRHHVYSFSPAKKFELPLYMGTPSAPVVFDKPGAVALGCNIHD